MTDPASCLRTSWAQYPWSSYNRWNTTYTYVAAYVRTYRAPSTLTPVLPTTQMSSKMSLRSVANTTAPSVALRSCGCARRFIPHSQSAPVLARRRSRSSTGSSSKSVGSGRNTPSPSAITRSARLKEKSRSESHLAGLASPPPPDQPKSGDILRPCLQPVYFSTTLLIRLGGNRQHYLEQVKYEMKYGPGPYQDEPGSDNQQFKTELEIQLENHTPAHGTSSNQT